MGRIVVHAFFKASHHSCFCTVYHVCRSVGVPVCVHASLRVLRLPFSLSRMDHQGKWIHTILTPHTVCRHDHFIPFHSILGLNLSFVIQFHRFPSSCSAVFALPYSHNTAVVLSTFPAKASGGYLHCTSSTELHVLTGDDCEPCQFLLTEPTGWWWIVPFPPFPLLPLEVREWVTDGHRRVGSACLLCSLCVCPVPSCCSS